MTTVTASVESRRARLAGGLVDAGVDAVLVTRLVNVRYLSGFSGSSGALLLAADGHATLATDGRYQDQAEAECPGVALLVTRAGPADLLAEAGRSGAGRVGFEAHDLTVASHRVLSEAFDGTLVPLEPVVEPLRSVKDAHELGLIREACRVSDAALASVLPGIRVGSTERGIAADLEAAMRRLGADGAAFESIVAGGPHSAIPHHTPTDRPLERGDLLKIDFGALVAGYHADETRTFVVGAPPADWQAELHAAVAAAQAAGVAALGPGVSGVAVDRAARQVLEEAGWGERFTHGLGHGVGLEIHEAPKVGARSTGTIGADMVITVEPGAYLPGRGGVRIEDTLVVSDAAPRVLTEAPRGLRVVG